MTEEQRPPLRSVCVYCGSSDGTDPAFRAAADQLGQSLGRAGLRLVYGGGSRGLMGAVARSTLDAGGQVFGVIPDFLREREQMLTQATDLRVVSDMHTRKQAMFEAADAFVALPGGVGTLEELVEQLTWVQLQRHAKPVVIVDVKGFWRPLLTLLAHMRENGFIRSDLEVRYLVAERVADVIPMIEAARAQERSDKNAEPPPPIASL